MRTWIVTHTNMSGEKFYYKVKAENRKQAKKIVVDKHKLYESTLTAKASETAEIFSFAGHSQIVIWDHYKR